MSKTLVETNVDLTLMVMDGNGDYYPTSVMTFQYYIAADAIFTTNLAENCTNLIVQIYNEHYRVFREREPNDLNYIGVVGILPRIISESEFANQPWLNGKCPTWEESNLIGLHSTDYNKLSPPFFEGLLKSNL